MIIENHVHLATMPPPSRKAELIDALQRAGEPPVRAAFAFLSGCTRRFDHNNLVHSIWSKAIDLSAAIWVERVPTEVNLADDPSRRHSGHIQEWRNHCSCVRRWQGGLQITQRVAPKACDTSPGYAG